MDHSHTIEFLPAHTVLMEPAMQQRPTHRIFALCLAAIFTLVMLGGIDQFSRRDEAPAQWAQSTSTRA